MSSERFEANCKRCGRVFEYGLFSRSYPYCVDCKVELDQYAIEHLKDDKLSDVPSTSSENEVERQQRYTKITITRWMITFAGIEIEGHPQSSP